MTTRTKHTQNPSQTNALSLLNQRKSKTNSHLRDGLQPSREEPAGDQATVSAKDLGGKNRTKQGDGFQWGELSDFLGDLKTSESLKLLKRIIRRKLT